MPKNSAGKYDTVDDLPAAVVNALKGVGNAAEIWRAAYNNAVGEYSDEQARYQVAWAAVKRKFEQRGGKWMAKMAGDTGGTVTIADVEVLKVGTWSSSLSGRVAITGDDVDAMVQAANDPEIDHAPLRIGHIDPRFDGEPALGWLSNVRRAGDRVVADLVDVPAKLADLVRSAFRRRSAEILWGVKTPSGRQYRAALAGLALLGVTPPAVKGLADVLDRYSGPTNEHDGEGRAVTIDGVDDPAVGVVVAEVLAALSGSGSDRDLAVDDGGHESHEPEVGVTDEQIRELLGLDADAAVTDQMRAVAKQIGDAKTAADAAADAGDASGKGEAGAGAAGGTGEGAPAASATDGADEKLITVDKSALEHLQRQAAAGESAMKILEEQERERELAAAMSGGKIGPASLDAYRALWSKDKASTRALLSSLPTVFSTATTEIGTAGSAAPSSEPSDDEIRAFLGDDFAPPKAKG